VNGQEQVIEAILKVTLVTGFASIAIWIWTYTALARWWRNPVGRSLVMHAGLIAVLLVPSTLSLYFHLSRGTSDIAAWLDTALITAITPVMLWRCVVWVRLSRAGELPSERVAALEQQVAELRERLDGSDGETSGTEGGPDER
jgi:hypothetical protein